ncbi:MAG: SIS domain-containing protein [Caulobacteraceae bacterium]|nr:MAG: SIS domain-containing protein [Caulobacteraceae bacterium]
MLREAGEASAVVAGQLAENPGAMRRLGERLRSLAPRAVVTCARGSSDHAATYAKYLFETRLGVLTSSSAMSVSSVYGSSQDLGNVLFLAISQSGRSPDLLSAARAARDGGALVVAMVNDITSPLAALADETIPLGAGPELSVAATKSYIASLAAIAHLTAEWSQDAELLAALDALPVLLGAAWALDWSPAADRLRTAHNLYVLGRGVGYAVAQEAALKFKETCGLHAESFSTAEVQHGPMALVGDGFPLLVFAQDDESRASIETLIAEMTARGADVWSAGALLAGPGVLPSLAAHPLLQPLAMIQSFYRMIHGLALARGYDPDQPPHLNKVTKTV